MPKNVQATKQLCLFADAGAASSSPEKGHIPGLAAGEWRDLTWTSSRCGRGPDEEARRRRQGGAGRTAVWAQEQTQRQAVCPWAPALLHPRCVVLVAEPSGGLLSHLWNRKGTESQGPACWSAGASSLGRQALSVRMGSGSLHRGHSEAPTLAPRCSWGTGGFRAPSSALLLGLHHSPEGLLWGQSLSFVAKCHWWSCLLQKEDNLAEEPTGVKSQVLYEGMSLALGPGGGGHVE